MNQKLWMEKLEELKGATVEKVAMEMSAIIGQPIDVDKPLPPILSLLCDPIVVTKDSTDFYFRIDAARTKEVYAIGSNGEVQLNKVSKETLQTLSVSPLTSKVNYMPINDVMSAKGYDSLALMKSDAMASMDLKEVSKFFAVLDAAVPAGNKLVPISGEGSKFTYKGLRRLRTCLKDVGDKFLLVTGSNIDDQILDWDYDENKYRSIADMVKDLSVEIVYAGHYTLSDDGASTTIVDPDVAYLIAVKSGLDGKPFVLARKDLNPIAVKDVEIESQKQRAVLAMPKLLEISGSAVAVFGYWGYEEFNVVARCPIALAKFSI